MGPFPLNVPVCPVSPFPPDFLNSERIRASPSLWSNHPLCSWPLGEDSASNTRTGSGGALQHRVYRHKEQTDKRSVSMDAEPLRLSGSGWTDFLGSPGIAKTEPVSRSS